MERQRTLAEKITCSGIGLHSGERVELTLRPSRAGSGIVFVRADLGGVEIPARADSVASIFRATTLARGDVSVATVEHLLASLYALGVDNARVEVDGPEIPVMDGSASIFVSLIRAAGIFEQPERRAHLRVVRPVEVTDGERFARVDPHEAGVSGLAIDYTIDFEHPAIRRQRLRIDALTPDVFESRLAAARTFGFLSEVAALREAGLALGGSLDNAVVLDEEKVLNPAGLRFPNEFARHKTLDLLGDLALLGLPLEGRVRVERGGHSLHQRLVRKLLAARGACARVGTDDEPLDSVAVAAGG